MKVNISALLAISIAFIISLVSIDQSSIISHPFQSEIKWVVNRIMPQGWGFFTKNVESEHYIFYSEDFSEVTRGKNSSPSNMFGFNRESRLSEVENSYILPQVNESEWIPCMSLTLQECYESSDNLFKKEIYNRYREKIYCGNFIIAVERITPWEWRLHESAKTPHPEKILLVGIKC